MGPGGNDVGARGGSSPGGSIKADFTTPSKGAETFLKAADAKDADMLAEAVALRARYAEFGSKHIEYLTDLLDKKATASILDELARELKDFKVLTLNHVKSSGTVEVIIGKDDSKTRNHMTRHLVMRREKEGWKLIDWTGLRETNPQKKDR